MKLINFIAALLTIGTTAGGVFTGIQWKGDEWGRPLAATVFGFGFAVASLLFMLVVIWAYTLIGRLRRECPVCKGAGVVRSGYDEIMCPVHSICPKCGGDGRIW